MRNSIELELKLKLISERYGAFVANEKYEDEEET